MNPESIHSVSVTVLGSGTCVPLPDRYPSSYFIRPSVVPGGWLVDIGPGALKRLAQAGGSYKEINSVFVSHIHPDHIGSLLFFLEALNYTPDFSRSKPLFIYGSKEVEEYLQLNLELTLPLRPDFPLDFIVLRDKMVVNQEGWTLKVRELKHSTTTLGFRWDIEGCILVYGADTEPCDGISELAEGADLLILESSFAQDNPTPGHLTTFQAGKIAKESSAKRLLLSHLYPEVAEMTERERESEVRASGYKGEIIFAEDLMNLKVCSRRKRKKS
ncbi:MBL fold metallo-hydrolase [candidate division WOR-3 bacterium]|nr:MBL fold metallo-hydrolase [candidate division WOR-3 bacterium]